MISHRLVVLSFFFTSKFVLLAACEDTRLDSSWCFKSCETAERKNLILTIYYFVWCAVAGSLADV